MNGSVDQSDYIVHTSRSEALLPHIQKGWASLVAQRVKSLPAMRETQVQSSGQVDPLEKEMTTHSSTPAWKIPWTEVPGRLHSMGSQRVRHDRATSQASLAAQSVKNLPAVQETQVQSLGWEGPLEKEMANHSRILARKIPWTEDLSGLQSTGSQRVGHDRVTNIHCFLEGKL